MEILEAAVLLGTVFITGYEKTLETLQAKNGISRSAAIGEVEKLTWDPVLTKPAFLTACRLALALHNDAFREDLRLVFPNEKAEKIFEDTKMQTRPYCTDEKAARVRIEELRRCHNRDLECLNRVYLGAWKIFGTETKMVTCPVCKTERRCQANTQWFRCKCGKRPYPFQPAATT